MRFSAEDIKNALSGRLPGEKSHRKMLPANRNLAPSPPGKEKVKRSSVLLLLFEEKEELLACLIKRPQHMKYHAGQVALPGGRIEKTETALETALRETTEEIGIKSGDIRILGSLSELYVKVSGYMIQPFVGWLETKPQFILNRHEVEKIILFPLLRYKNDFKLAEIDTLTGKLNVPCIPFDGETVWGATAMIISEFFDLLDDNFPSEGSY